MKNYTSITRPIISIPLLVFFLLILFGQISFAANLKIKVFEKTEIENERILLGEISLISADDPLLIQKIMNIDLGKAPVPGKKKNIKRTSIVFRLKNKGLDPLTLKLFVPDNAEVSRAAKEISKTEIEKIVFSFLEKNLPWDSSRTNIRNIRINSSILLPKGNISCKVVPTKNAKYLGTTPLSLNFSVNGKFAKRIWVSVYIEVMKDVVVTKRPLGRFKEINENDIYRKSMNLAELPSNVISTCEEVLGKRTRRAIDSNVALRTDLVEFPPLVRRGDVVMIIAESENMKITTLGIIKETGRKGDMIKVENLDSSKIIYARVLNSKNVKVEY